MAIRLPIAESQSAAPPILTPVFSPVLPPAGISPGSGELLRVGDLAQRTNKTVRALHLYEELGLLTPVERSKGGFRLYDPDAEVRVRWITKLQDMGFSLPDIREVLAGWERSGSATGAMTRIRQLYLQKLEETDRQLERLKSLRGELASSVAYLETCEVCDPLRLISACSHCDLHGCDAPELVAGLHGHRHT
jgi:MerR family copper efflux transcriptional regulator